MEGTANAVDVNFFWSPEENYEDGTSVPSYQSISSMDTGLFDSFSSPVDNEIDCCSSMECSSMCCSCLDCHSSTDYHDDFQEVVSSSSNSYAMNQGSLDQQILLPADSTLLFQRQSSLRIPSLYLNPGSLFIKRDSSYSFVDKPVNAEEFPLTLSSEIVANTDALNPSENLNSEVVKPKPHPLMSKKDSYGEGDQDSDDDWTLIPEADSFEYSSGRNRPKMWSREECDRLNEGIKRFGIGHWTEISKFVGTRCVSQCINKWKNGLSKKRERWTASATKQLKEYIQKGATEKEIAKLMPQFTYIQLYQQIRKLRTNTKPWADWEIERLIQLKTEGRMGDTEIGRQLDNRHRDNVKNVWNRIRRERNL